MKPRAPLGVLWNSAQRQKRKRGAVQRELGRHFDAVETIIMLLPPHIVARVPAADFNQQALRVFMLREAVNADIEARENLS